METLHETLEDSTNTNAAKNSHSNDNEQTLTDVIIDKNLREMGLLETDMSVTDNCTSQLTTEELCNILHDSDSEESVPYDIDSNIDAYRIENAHIESNCIINFGYVFEQMHSFFDNHSALDCNFRDMVFIGFHTNGLRTKFKFQCRVCHYGFDVWSEPAKQATLNVDEGAVAGTVLAGIGYMQFGQVMACMNIQNMSYTKYNNLHTKVADAFEIAAKDSMKEVGEEERKIANEHKDIIHGTPQITVVADGSWMKRSYRTGKYDSLSGVGVICGVQTNKVLHIGVRNKYCATCYRAEKLQKSPTKHKCYKNWGSNRSSTSMEADAIAEGFKCSLSEHGLIYSKLIADGDSSVYKKIREGNPYRSVCVEKIECRNHLLRNLMSKLKEICATKGRFGKIRKVIEGRSLRIRTAVTKAVLYRIKENTCMADKIIQLRKDIMNVISHVFDEHKECAEIAYFCDGIPKENVINYIPELKATGLYDKLQNAMKQLSWNAKSLLYNKDSNRAETFNAIISKCIGGKRINFGLRGSYEARCYAAVLTFNTGCPIMKLAEMLDRQPGKIAVDFENKIKCKRDMARMRNKEITYAKHRKATTDKDYGPNANKPDADDEEMEVRKKEHMDMLYDWQRKREEIEKETIDQSGNGLWQYYRSKMLTASHFGNICKMRASTSCISKVKSILYPQDIRVEALQYGSECEEIARNDMEKTLNIRIERCGLFIDEEIPFLGASPDGLIDHDGIVEIKCPFAARLMTPDDAINANVSNLRSLYKTNEETKMNMNHNFYYQIQGQLHITKRKYCIFAIWTSLGMKVEKIIRDDTFWQTNMLQLLKRFYEKCVLPEILDPRHERNMPIRDPEHIMEAKKVKEKEKMEKWKNLKRKITDDNVSKEIVDKVAEDIVLQDT